MRKTRAGKPTIAEIIKKISDKFNNQPFALVVVADVMEFDCSRRDLENLNIANKTCTRNAMDNLLRAYIYDLFMADGTQGSIHYSELENKIRMILVLQLFVERIFTGENPRRGRKRRRASKSTSAR